MSHYVDGQAVAALSQNRSVPWRAFLGSIFKTLRLWRRRGRERRELLDYLASDHRAAIDIGLDRGAARLWAARPFWEA